MTVTLPCCKSDDDGTTAAEPEPAPLLFVGLRRTREKLPTGSAMMSRVEGTIEKMVASSLKRISKIREKGIAFSRSIDSFQFLIVVESGKRPKIRPKAPKRGLAQASCTTSK
jgi:hypothetical protein